MTNFSFDTTDAVSAGNSTGSDVDWDALNEYTISKAKTADKTRSLKGVISGITDLGIHQPDPFEEGYTGSTEQLSKIDKGSTVEERDGKKILITVSKPSMQVAITIDFPSVMLGKGQFFGGKSVEDKPLRLLLNGEFFSRDNIRVVNKRYSVKEKKYDDNVWAFSKNNMLHILAESVGILDSNGYFTKDRIGELIGKCAQFQVRVYMKPSNKDPSKLYYTEEIKIAGMIPEDEETNEVILPKFDESILYSVNFKADNEPLALKNLRASVKNTIKLAENYEGSKIKEQLEAEGWKNKTPVEKKEEDKERSKQQEATPNDGGEDKTPDSSYGDPDFDDNEDDGIPF